MGYAKDPMTGKIYETDADGNPIREASSASPPQQQGRIFTLPPNPKDVRTEQRQEKVDARSAANADRANAIADRQANTAEHNIQNQNLNNTMQLRAAYDALPTVKEYRVAVQQLATGLRTKGDATGDNALIYAYAKAMDPGSVVRESEMSMAASGASVIDKAVAGFKKQFGVEGGGQLPVQVRDRLRREMINKTTQMSKGYDEQRDRFAADAKAFGMDPVRVIGDHDAKPFVQLLKDYDRDHAPAANGSQGAADFSTYQKQLQAIVGDKSKTPEQRMATALAFSKQSNRGVDPKQIGAAIAAGGGSVTNDPSFVPPSRGYDDSYLSQAMSGINKGALANIPGAPVDLATAAINLGTTGINALANTNIGKIENPVLGSQWIKNNVLDPIGATRAVSADPSKQFVRRVGESVGASFAPAGMAGSLERAGMTALAGLGGGIGGATAQRVAPGNPYAEMLGEAAGGGVTALGIANQGRKAAQGLIESAIPTVDQLKGQAGNLYRTAESRGVVAGPAETQALADNVRAVMTKEGQVLPDGGMTGATPKAAHVQNMVDAYGGQTINPTQIQQVRKSATALRGSSDTSDARLGTLLTNEVDNWAAPIAPELSQARDVASRYLTAQQLEKARSLAHANNSKYTASGLENALRQEYRGLDRANIRGSQNFTDDVGSAIEAVNQGTPGLNFARGIGRLAPTSVMSSGLGAVLPAMAMAGATGSGPIGGMFGAGLAGAGMIGRAIATKGGLRAANIAELTARNGGAIPQAPMLSPDILEMIRKLSVGESAKYLAPKEG